MTVCTVNHLPAATHGETARCLFAIELSKQSWVIGFITPLCCAPRLSVRSALCASAIVSRPLRPRGSLCALIVLSQRGFARPTKQFANRHRALRSPS